MNRNITWAGIWPLLLMALCAGAPSPVSAAPRPLIESVTLALETSPQIQAQAHEREAFLHEIQQVKGAYLPTIDLLLGYGLEQHSDEGTRERGADPSDTDWDPRGDASVTLTQKVYDAGETGSQIGIQKAVYEAADYRLKAAIQAVALEAVTAHMDLFRIRELVRLAENNVKIHQEIHRSLAEREKAGAGSIADVSQAHARLSRAESSLYLAQADLDVATATYLRITGETPGPLAYSGLPNGLPDALEAAIARSVGNNPELLALAAELAEADARVRLAKTAYRPKLDLELSSKYNDQLEGDPSWQHTNAAMLLLRWNLFNGGQDRAGVKAAFSRRQRSDASRRRRVIELREATVSAWALLSSLRRQEAAYRDAVTYSYETFDAYLKQFSISKRTLLDVLIAENDYVQSAVQLISAHLNQITAAYRILALNGDLVLDRRAHTAVYPEDLQRITRGLTLPALGR
ncbi:MAG: TolC family outer membrane protein [Desulfosarcinaceae bacterium]|nr:TolC family outer membrane protein [Desulfosarcinaceae bacterium]